MSDPSPLTAVPGVVGVSSVTPTTPVVATSTIVKTSVVNSFIEWLSSTSFLHVAGITAVATLTGIGVIPQAEGTALLTGLIGLGITTTSGR